MWTCHFVLLICLSVAVASDFELFNANGWIPVSSDIVYNQIKHGITQPPRFTKDVQVLNTDILSFVSQKEFESVRTEQETGDAIEEDNEEHVNVDDTSRNEPRFLLKSSLPPNRFQFSTNQNLKTDGSVRRSKKLADTDTYVLHNSITLPKNDHKYKDFLKKYKKLEDNLTGDETHTYEVIENETIEDKHPEESSVSVNGYEYDPPNQVTKQNFTNDLIKHLFKYNIKNVDNLQNYALSRRSKTASPVTHDHIDHPYKTLRVQVPIRYNSLNHLSVDPLLAVFLSNYGHYLQGQYGVQNNYNNLYGYLASNNMHNNRPFGFYKLFSDTDSSTR